VAKDGISFYLSVERGSERTASRSAPNGVIKICGLSHGPIVSKSSQRSEELVQTNLFDD
jgi:hypothetical protein